MAQKSGIAMFSLLCFLTAAFYGVFTTQNQLYLQTLWFLIGITIALFALQVRKINTPQQQDTRLKPRHVNFNAFDRNSEQLGVQQEFQPSQIVNRHSDPQEVQQQRHLPKKSDKETRKQNMINHFQVEQDPNDLMRKQSMNANRMYYGDDTRSQFSQSGPQAPQIQPQALFGRSCYQPEIQKKCKVTEGLLSKMIKKMGDAHIRVEELFFNSFLPTFVNEFKDHLVNVNRMMKEHYSQKIVEIDIFFANKPYDINSNKHEKSIGMKSITLEEVFYLKNQMKLRQKEIIIAPHSVEKFAKDRAEFIKECDLLEVFSESLDLGLLNRNHITDKKTILLKLSDFCENNIKPVYQAEGLEEKFASDYEILFTVFINTIIQCVKYEKSKHLKDINSNNLNLLKLVDVSIISLDSFALKLQSSDQPSRNIFIQQKLEFQNQEPQFHYYSDFITKQLSRDQDQKTLKINEYILYTSRDSNSLNGLVCYYLLHLLSISKLQQWQQLQQLEMDQKMIKCLIRMAKDLSYLVTII